LRERLHWRIRVKRSVAFLVLAFVAALWFSPQDLNAFGKNKIVYDTFDWQVYRSTHFDIYFYEEERESLQKVVNFAESAYDDLSRKFNFQIATKIPLIFYATHSAFQQTNVELMFIPEGVGAFAEPVKNRMVMPIDMPDEDLLALIKHELTHIFEYEILFQGRLGRRVSGRPPLWFMEGLASFMAEDEDSRARMVLRDAVVNDVVPSVTRDFGGYFAYRFGHAVFRYIVDKYDWDGLRDFVYEYRNSLGASIERPLKRAFDVTAEEFDTDFRAWLRRQYLPAIVTKGEPREYGQIFRVGEGIRSQELSPAISPSGDLLLSLTTYKEDVDLAIFNVPKRTLWRNLTRGYSDQYEYVVAQGLTTGPRMGRDVAFSPDGDRVAAFVKKERGRSLLLLNALTGRIEKMVAMEVEQQLNPTFSPDGTLLAFHGFSGNRADIFIYDLVTGEVTNLTQDSFYDAAPVFAPDGRSIVYSSVVDGYAKLFRLDLDTPSRRFQLTTGPWNDIDATFSPDGSRIFYASDRQTGRTEEIARQLAEQDERFRRRDGEEVKPPDPSNFAAYNIYSLDLASGDVLQYTDVLGGSFTPSVFLGEENEEKVVFASYYKQRWSLYVRPTKDPIRVAERVELASEPLMPGERTEFLPPVEVAIDPSKIEKAGGFKMFIEDAQVNAGVASDQTYVSRSVIFMSDLLGNRRLVASLDSVSTFANFDFYYLDLRRRLSWGARVFDDRTFFVTQDPGSGRVEQQRELYRQTAALGLVSYPFDRYRRIDAGLGYMSRDFNFPTFSLDGDLSWASYADEFPLASATFTGDTAQYKSFGPISGRRYRLTSTYAHDLDEGGALSNDYNLDFRQYLQLTSRTLIATRLFAGYSDGNRPNFYYFGGLNTLRGYDFRTLVGTRAAFANVELRFPLIDVIATPAIVLTDIRGSLFFDVGGAYFPHQNFEFMRDGKLADAKGSVGYGVALRFWGLELHWDFARRIHTDDDKFRTQFWIGQTF
jgi:hypothetical protein